MTHPNTEGLIEYWRSRQIGADAPPRASIDPGDFARLAPQAFILGRESRHVYPFRLVGGAVATLFGRDLRGDNGLSFWRPKDALALSGALELSLRRPEPVLSEASLRLRNGETAPVEVLLAPLSGPRGAPDRFLGLLQPLGLSLSGLGGQGLTFELTSLESGGAAPVLRLAAAYGRRL